MSGPPASIEDIEYLEEFADCTPVIERNGVCSRSITIDVSEISSKFFCRSYNSKNSESVSSSFRIDISGSSYSTPILLIVMDESDDEFKNLRPCGLGRFQYHIYGKEPDEERYEMEAFVYLPSANYKMFQTAIKHYAKNDLPLTITVSLPQGEGAGEHEFLWIEALEWI